MSHAIPNDNDHAAAPGNNKARPTLGYPTRTAAVMALRRQDFPWKAIAEKLGISPENARALGSSTRKLAAKPAMPGNRGRKPAADAGPAVLTDLFPYHQKEMMREHARKRGLTVPQLIQRIVETVFDDNMVDAVLDDQVSA